MKDLKTKESEFRMACNSFKNQFDAEMVNQFFEYWSEPNRSGTKLRWELEKTWEIGRRLKTWERNNYKWNRNGSQFNQSGNGKLGTSAARIEAARKF